MFMTDVSIQYEEPRQFVDTGASPLVSMFKIDQASGDVSLQL